MRRLVSLTLTIVLTIVAGSAWAGAQETSSQRQPTQPEAALKTAPRTDNDPAYVVRAGTRIPLVLVNSISTKSTEVGDRVYLQTSFPIAVSGHIVVPEGSYVTGTVTQVKRPGRIRGKGELYVRFDTLMLRNGVQRDFRGDVSGVDGALDNRRDKEGKIEGDSTKGKDVGTVVEPAGAGAMIGAIAGAGKGAAIGGGVGAAAGMAAVLLTRGSEVRLLRGTALEMQLDRDLSFSENETNFLGTNPAAPLPAPPREESGNPRRGLGLPGISPFPGGL